MHEITVGEDGDVTTHVKEWILDYLETDPDKPEISDGLCDSYFNDCMKAVMVSNRQQSSSKNKAAA